MTSHSFGKNHRLLNSSDFSAVFGEAPFRASHPKLLILARANQREVPRLGLVVAKKNVPTAVSRNRFKRLVRESFRLQQHNIPAIDAIVLARRGADTLSNSELQQILNGLWKRVAKKATRAGADRTRSGY